MKKLIICSFAIVCNLFSMGQNQPTLATTKVLQHEIGINVVTLGPSVNWVYSNRGHGSVQFLSGVYFRAKKGKNVARASLGYYKESHSSREFIVGQDSETAEITLGYERNFTEGRWIPYVYSDVIFRYRETDYTHIYQAYPKSRYDPMPPVEFLYDHTKIFGVGLAAGFGLRFELNKKLSFLYEANFIKQFDLWQNSEWFYRRNLKRDIAVGFNPLRTLGVSFKF